MRQIGDKLLTRGPILVFLWVLFAFNDALIRYWFISLPATLWFYAGLVALILKIARKRKETGRELMDIENQSGWITFVEMVATLAGGTALAWLWLAHNLARYWYLAVPAAVVSIVGVILLPEPAGDYSGPGIGG
jgi:Ni/Fe-hydrogenase subunit HybB-like protein